MKKKQQNKTKKEKNKRLKNKDLKQIFHDTGFDAIFVQVMFSMLGASSYKFENKEKYYLLLRSTEGQFLAYSIICKKLFVRIFLLLLLYANEF